MQDLILEKTESTPEVNFNVSQGKLLISGRSTPVYPGQFYAPIKNWVEDYRKNPHDTTEYHIMLEYFNTASSKNLLDIFTELMKLQKSGKEVKYFWYAEEGDDDMIEAGEEYENILGISFEFRETEF